MVFVCRVHHVLVPIVGIEQQVHITLSFTVVDVERHHRAADQLILFPGVALERATDHVAHVFNSSLLVGRHSDVLGVGLAGHLEVKQLTGQCWPVRFSVA